MKEAAVFLLFAAAAGAAVADEPTESSCTVISPEANGLPKTTAMDGLKVIEQTAKEGRFALPRGAPKDVQAVLCKRSTVVPATHDYKVLQAGFTLYLTDDLARMAALGLVDGQVRFNLLDGALTEAEQGQLARSLPPLQAAFAAKP